MGKRPRIGRSAEEKWQIVQEGIKSGNVSETCRRHGISPSLLFQWNDEAEQGAKAALRGKSAASRLRDLRMNAMIFIVDDEAGVATTLMERLQKQGYAVSIARDGNAGMKMALLREPFDLVILDLMLPGQDNLSIRQSLRRLGSNKQILLLRARRKKKDKVNGLQAGADDYLKKPFKMAELSARMYALLERAGPGTVPSFVRYKFGDLQIDARRAEVTRRGRPVTLSAMEFRLLEYFVEHRGATISRDELLREVWAYSGRPRSRTVDAHVAFLRRKIEPDPQNPRFILTLVGLGYKFMG